MLVIESAANRSFGHEGDVAASVRENFGANLRRLLAAYCRENEVTQEHFAAELGVLPQKVSQWKTGVVPRPEQIDEIARVLGVVTEELFAEVVPVPVRDLDAILADLAKKRGYRLTKD